MNRNWYAIFALITITLFSLGQYALTTQLMASFKQELSGEFELIFQSQTTVLGDLVRNDILAGNFREARNKLAKAVVNSPVVGCQIRSEDGSTVETLIETASSSTPGLVRAEVPILFSKDGPRWGVAEFTLNPTHVAGTLAKLQSSLQAAQLTGLTFLILLIAVLHYFLYQSGRRLERYLGGALLGIKQTTGRFFARIWEPLLNRVDSVADQYGAVNMVIGKIEEEKSRAVGVTQIIHDLKAPLSALRIGLPAAQFRTPEHGELVNSALQRIDDMVTKSLSEKKGSSAADNIARADLKALVTSILPELQSQLECLLLWDEDVAEYGTYLDGQHFQRIILNFVKNSYEAKASQVRILFKQSADMNYLIVADNGAGIPNSVLNKLGHVPVTEGKGDSGSGQGLYDAFRAASSWGGTLKISSEEGRGTQVVLALPRA